MKPYKLCGNCNKAYNTPDQLCPECRERHNAGDMDWFSNKNTTKEF